MKIITKDIVANIIFLTVIIIYFICFNLKVAFLESAILSRIIDISSMCFLGIAIILFEIGYKKEKKKIFVNGIEILILAIYILLIKHILRATNIEITKYTKIGIYAIITYYIAKTGVTYTKSRYDELKNLSDIKEIVKEEPRKKATKRKNIKVEEGK